MFFKQIWRNSARKRRNNGLFYTSLVIAIVAFYTLLSLESQDVMRFLATIESDAVRKLLTLIPVIYLISLFFVFFLVYFALSYELQDRQREFGLYLTLGMKRSRLFALLFVEQLWSSAIALLIGLPVAMLLTEGISLATSRWIGLDIIQHQLTLSPQAILWTILGFILVQMVALAILALRMWNLEPLSFLKTVTVNKQQLIDKAHGNRSFKAGIILLVTAYLLGVFGLGAVRLTIFPLVFLALVICGITGMFKLYNCLGFYQSERIAKQRTEASGLQIFTMRQIQESVFAEHRALAIAALLLLVAMASLSYGVGRITKQSAENVRTVDFSLQASTSEVKTFVDSEGVAGKIKAAYPVYLAFTAESITTTELQSALRQQPETNYRDNLLERFEHDDRLYLIAASGYNALLEAQRGTPLQLAADEFALYTSMPNSEVMVSTLEKALKPEINVSVGGQRYRLHPEVQKKNIVADRAITLYLAYIVPDDVYHTLVNETEPFAWNLHLSNSFVEEKGLLQAIMEFEELLKSQDLAYESYLGGIGRNLFYNVASSYLTLYLGVLFLLIGNTVIGLKYLIQQRRTRHRYLTLLTLGASRRDMADSIAKQIRLFFNLVLVPAVVSSIFAILTLFLHFTKLPPEADPLLLLGLTAVALAGFVLVQLFYISLVKQAAQRDVSSLQLEQTNRS